jgi:hypothetical protein
LRTKWVNPPPKEQKTENEFPPQDATTYTPFSIIKKQVRKKQLSKKSKKERISAKSISLAERVEIQKN